MTSLISDKPSPQGVKTAGVSSHALAPASNSAGQRRYSGADALGRAGVSLPSAPRPRWFSVRAVLPLVLATLWAGLARSQSQFTVLHNFGSGTDGTGLWSSVAFDAQVNVYGVTFAGGTNGDGTVFELSPQPSGEWDITILHSFPSSPDDGEAPLGGLALDAEDNVYGTTSAGGGSGEYGTVFELTPGAGGWQETLLHSFGANDPACCPSWGNRVLLDQRGNLYDVGGVVFELSSGPEGWTESVLHTFTPQNGDGSGPEAGPIMDAAGNLYGTTMAGGGSPICPANDGCGTVYQLQPVRSSARGQWKEQVLHAFGNSSSDGRRPGIGSLAMDRQGNLYGVTQQGGANLCVDVGCGTVYRLMPEANGTWTEAVLYNFTPAAYGPGGGVAFDRAGNLYGTTLYGGGKGCGIIYKLAPASPTTGGEWQFTVLHSFEVSDGCQPDANLTLGPDGNLYGTAATGGQYFGGTVFEITP